MTDDEQTLPDEDVFTLCDRFGIERGYYNIWGHYQELSLETARHLLNAFGVEAGAGRSLNQLQERVALKNEERLLPSVVIHNNQSSQIHFTMKRDAIEAKASLNWEIAAEHAQIFSGAVEPENIQDHDQAEVKISFQSPHDLSNGYHILRIWQSNNAAYETRLIVTPGRCIDVPSRANSARYWGISVQLYSLRSNRNWGIGDFTDLANLIGITANFGAAFVGLSPLHAISLQPMSAHSPYSPNSRHFLNVAYLDVELIEDFTEAAYALSEQQAASLEALRQSDLVDHAGVVALKMEVLEILFEHFYERHFQQNTKRAQAFCEFQTRRGDRLRQFAVYEVRKHIESRNTVDTESRNGVSLANNDDADLKAFIEKHLATIVFFEYLQWQADVQLLACKQAANKHNMLIGLYHDVAVGSTPDSADVESNPELFAGDVEIGAPADDFSPDGQSWGTVPMRPDVLASEGYRTFISLLRDNMRYAGAIRIDHVLGLLRLFWVPRGQRAAAGAYVRYPLDVLLAIVALESERNQCIVVGEDLGNVPNEIRDALLRWGILSTRVFYFEKYWEGDHAYKIPEHYPEQALTTIGGHDLPTLRGFWEERDLKILSRLKRFPSQQFADDRYAERRADKERLLRRMYESGNNVPNVNPGERLTREAAAELAIALYHWLSYSPSLLLLIQPEDIFGTLEQTNVPGTVDEEPNWQRKLEVSIEEWPHHPGFVQLARLLNEERSNR